MAHVILDEAVRAEGYLTVCAKVCLGKLVLITEAFLLFFELASNFLLFVAIAHPVLFCQAFQADGALILHARVLLAGCADDCIAAFWTKPDFLEYRLKANHTCATLEFDWQLIV